MAKKSSPSRSSRLLEDLEKELFAESESLKAPPKENLANLLLNFDEFNFLSDTDLASAALNLPEEPFAILNPECESPIPLSANSLGIHSPILLDLDLSGFQSTTKEKPETASIESLTEFHTAIQDKFESKRHSIENLTQFQPSFSGTNNDHFQSRRTSHINAHAPSITPFFEEGADRFIQNTSDSIEGNDATPESETYTPDYKQSSFSGKNELFSDATNNDVFSLDLSAPNPYESSYTTPLQAQNELNKETNGYAGNDFDDTIKEPLNVENAKILALSSIDNPAISKSPKTKKLPNKVKVDGTFSLADHVLEILDHAVSNEKDKDWTVEKYRLKLKKSDAFIPQITSLQNRAVIENKIRNSLLKLIQSNPNSAEVQFKEAFTKCDHIQTEINSCTLLYVNTRNALHSHIVSILRKQVAEGILVPTNSSSSAIQNLTDENSVLKEGLLSMDLKNINAMENAYNLEMAVETLKEALIMNAKEYQSKIDALELNLITEGLRLNLIISDLELSISLDHKLFEEFKLENAKVMDETNSIAFTNASDMQSKINSLELTLASETTFLLSKIEGLENDKGQTATSSNMHETLNNQLNLQILEATRALSQKNHDMIDLEMRISELTTQYESNYENLKRNSTDARALLQGELDFTKDNLSMYASDQVALKNSMEEQSLENQRITKDAFLVHEAYKHDTDTIALDLQSKIASLESSLVTETGILLSKIRTLEEEIDIKSTAVSSMHDTLNSQLQAQVSESNRTVSQKNSDMLDLEMKLNELEMQHEINLENLKRESVDARALLQGELDFTKDNLHAHEREQASFKASIADQSLRNERMATMSNDMQSKIDVLEMALASETGALLSKIKSLENEIESKSTAVSAMHDDLSIQLQTQVKEANRTIAQKNSDMLDLEMKINELEMQHEINLDNLKRESVDARALLQGELEYTKDNLHAHERDQINLKASIAEQSMENERNTTNSLLAHENYIHDTDTKAINMQTKIDVLEMALASETGALLSKIRLLENEIELKSTAVSTMQDTLSSQLQMQINDANRTIAQKNSDMLDLEMKLNELEMQHEVNLDSLKKNSTDAHTLLLVELDHTKDNLHAYERDQASLKASWAEQSIENERTATNSHLMHESYVHDTEIKTSSMQSKIDALEVTLASETALLLTKINVLQVEMNSNSAAANEIHQSLNVKLETQILDANNALSLKNSDMLTLEVQIKDLELQHGINLEILTRNAVAEQSALQDEFDNSKNSLQAYERDQISLKATLAAQACETEKLLLTQETNRKDMDANALNLQSKIDFLELNLTSEAASMKSKIKGLETEIDFHLKSSNDSHESFSKQLQSQIVVSSRALAQKNSDLLDLEMKINEMEMEHEKNLEDIKKTSADAHSLLMGEFDQTKDTLALERDQAALKASLADKSLESEKLLVQALLQQETTKQDTDANALLLQSRIDALESSLASEALVASLKINELQNEIEFGTNSTNTQQSFESQLQAQILNSNRILAQKNSDLLDLEMRLHDMEMLNDANVEHSSKNSTDIHSQLRDELGVTNNNLLEYKKDQASLKATILEKAEDNQRLSDSLTNALRFQESFRLDTDFASEKLMAENLALNANVASLQAQLREINGKVESSRDSLYSPSGSPENMEGPIDKLQLKKKNRRNDSASMRRSDPVKDDDIENYIGMKIKLLEETLQERNHYIEELQVDFTNMRSEKINAQEALLQQKEEFEVNARFNYPDEKLKIAIQELKVKLEATEAKLVEAKFEIFNQDALPPKIENKAIPAKTQDNALELEKLHAKYEQELSNSESERALTADENKRFANLISSTKEKLMKSTMYAEELEMKLNKVEKENDANAVKKILSKEESERMAAFKLILEGVNNRHLEAISDERDMLKGREYEIERLKRELAKKNEAKLDKNVQTNLKWVTGDAPVQISYWFG